MRDENDKKDGPAFSIAKTLRCMGIEGLKPKQMEVIESFVSGKDTFVACICDRPFYTYLLKMCYFPTKSTCWNPTAALDIIPIIQRLEGHVSQLTLTNRRWNWTRPSGARALILKAIRPCAEEGLATRDYVTDKLIFQCMIPHFGPGLLTQILLWRHSSVRASNNRCRLFVKQNKRNPGSNWDSWEFADQMFQVLKRLCAGMNLHGRAEDRVCYIVNLKCCKSLVLTYVNSTAVGWLSSLDCPPSTMQTAAQMW